MQLNLPEQEFKIKKDKNNYFIFDSYRKKYVALTPEEWVRQNFVAFLVKEKHYPASLINNEVPLTQNGISRRCDTLIIDRFASPHVIIEYKAPNVKITQATFDQILRYNLVFKAKYLMVSNGMMHFCCKVNYEENKCIFLDNIPNYSEL